MKKFIFLLHFVLLLLTFLHRPTLTKLKKKEMTHSMLKIIP